MKTKCVATHCPVATEHLLPRRNCFVSIIQKCVAFCPVCHDSCQGCRFLRFAFQGFQLTSPACGLSGKSALSPRTIKNDGWFPYLCMMMGGRSRQLLASFGNS